ncbi:unnamed protein product [Acanthoscelides obtectus]|uniref:Ubiquitin-like domain-containing protein n=1 Tax=Acanthoscelides obtectus TaxID=200917 RepID=A0A9P0K417_ACAOB|nr:unnamed protein product [Acanthoscelides obtectus]CAK1676702.1 Tubulin-specific chaperone cofactor E-like protein [Acanthoscelides obtectus]
MLPNVATLNGGGKISAEEREGSERAFIRYYMDKPESERPDRTVSDLKQKLERFAGFSANKMRLFYVDQDLRDTQGPEEMKFPSKKLYRYNIRSGDEIIMIEK